MQTDFGTVFRNALVVFAAILGGCAPLPLTTQSTGPGFGDSTLHNEAVQVVNPNPPTDAAAPDLDGKRAALAIDRYQAGKTVKPEAMRTSAGGTAGAATGP